MASVSLLHSKSKESFVSCPPTTIKLKENAIKISDNPQILEVIREEQRSPSMSLKLQPSAVTAKSPSNTSAKCLCSQDSTNKPNKVNPVHVENLLKDKVEALRAEYDKLLQKEIATLKERFNLIIHNEQMRTSFMLREAHRERQEKITALESQLHCKNLAALMYVMCSERTRSRLEKLQLVEEYTKYITGLHEILIDGQRLILHLSRGYKTAARVDYEWREKMKQVVSEFMNFIYHFAGGPPENNQFYINLPKLLKTEAPIEDDPEEDPCEESVDEEETTEEGLQKSHISPSNKEKNWWEMLEGDSRPFIVFGDMAEFQPPQRRAVLKVVKAKKTAPKIWKEYKFNEMSIHSNCNNADYIKDTMTYPRYKQSLAAEMSDQDTLSLKPNINAVSGMTLSSTNPRQTALSIDIRGGDMGSILRIITMASMRQPPEDKTNLLGVKDSLEVISTTMLHNKKKAKSDVIEQPLKLDISKRRLSHFNDLVEKKEPADDDSDNNHTDSLVIPTHVPDADHKINFERICPVDKCEKLHVDSFMRSLPVYMRANPFMHFQQTFEEYEPCTKEQLDLLKQRIEKKKLEDKTEEVDESPLSEWETGMATQTSVQSFIDPCNCPGPNPTPVDSNFVFNLHDLVPVKLVMDSIQRECFFDERIEYNRFELIGKDESKQYRTENTDFKTARAHEITNILRQHPSLLDIFQANAH